MKKSVINLSSTGFFLLLTGSVSEGNFRSNLSINQKIYSFEILGSSFYHCFQKTLIRLVRLTGLNNLNYLREISAKHGLYQ